MAKPRKPQAASPERGAAFYILLTSVILLTLIGLVMVFSSSHVEALINDGDSFLYLKQQLKWVAIGFLLMFFFMKANFRSLRGFSKFFAVAACVLLALIFIPDLGEAKYGATRWLNLGFISFQPSEIAKFALIFVAADILARKRELMADWREMAFPLLPLFAVMAGLVMLQPDLGTTLILLSILLVTVWVGGILFRHLGALVGVSLAAVAALIVSAPYRWTRLTGYLNPGNDPDGAGYQIIQSTIAMGSGGIFGVGLGMSKQKFFYLPAAHTDFIFAVIGEEGGLLATLSVIILFCLVAYACVRISTRATTYFDRLIASGFSAMIIVTALLNMGAVTGVLPITGVPLPFVSYGGTSLVLTLSGVGILLNIATRERKSSEGIIDARDHFRGGNRRPPVSRARTGRRTSQQG